MCNSLGRFKLCRFLIKSILPRKVTSSGYKRVDTEQSIHLISLKKPYTQQETENCTKMKVVSILLLLTAVVYTTSARAVTGKDRMYYHDQSIYMCIYQYQQYIYVYIYIAEEPDYSRAEEEALFNELMSQLAESQGEDEDEGVAQDDDDEGGLEDYILQRYLQHVARTQGNGKAKIQWGSFIRRVSGFVKKAMPYVHHACRIANAVGKK